MADEWESKTSTTINEANVCLYVCVCICVRAGSVWLQRNSVTKFLHKVRVKIFTWVPKVLSFFFLPFELHIGNGGGGISIVSESVWLFEVLITESGYLEKLSSVERRGSKQSWKLAQIVANLLGAILQRTQTVRISFHLNLLWLRDNFKITMMEINVLKGSIITLDYFKKLRAISLGNLRI